MPTEAELIAAIDANPEEDAPRLAHADWLQANGDPDRAEFIRLQVEGVPDWDQRLSELLDANRKRWLEGRPVSDGMVWEFERGYPEAVEFRSLKAFRAGWEAAAHRARHLVFACLNGNASSLAAEPGLSLARSLRLRFCYRGRGLLDLLRSPHLPQLERLSLTGDGLTDEFVVGLAALSSLPSLVALELCPWGQHAEFAPSALEALAFSPSMSRLVELRLDSCSLQRSANVLWRAGSLPMLTTLGLTRARLRPECLAGLADGDGLPRLEALDLAHNSLGEEGAEALARSGRRLRRLSLDHNDAGDAGAIALAGAGCLGRLERLGLGANSVSDDGARAIAASAHLRALRSLDLEHNLIGEAGVLALGQSRSLRALKRLNLWHNPAPPALVKAAEERFREGKPPLEELPTIPATPAPMVDAPVVGDADEDGLVRAIWADPWDEVARNVYADWLEEKGKPHHAALLRARKPKEREAALRRAQAVAQADAPCPLELVATEEGLLRVRVRLRPLRSKACERDGPAWLRRHSVAVIVPVGEASDWAALFAAPWLVHARGLNFEGAWLGRALVRGLASSPNLAGLASLDLTGARAPIEDLAALFRAPAWAGLARLLLGQADMNPDGLRALVDSPLAAGLRHLTLGACYPTLEAATLIAGSQSLRGLVTLNLSRASMSIAELKALGDSSTLASLRNLDLSYNWLDDVESGVLAAAPLLPRLHRLRLSHNRGSQEGMVRLARAVAGTPHCRLVLGSSQVTGRNRKALVEVLGERLVLE
jgi:uncharacterized protein (TIGR02996 family)